MADLTDCWACDTDPRDPNFTATDLVLAYHRSESASSVRSAKLYTPAAEAASWDGAPGITNIAIGHRHGFSYATVRLVATKDTRIPGASDRGYRVALQWHNYDFHNGWTVGEKREAWVFARSPAGHWRSLDEIRAMFPAPPAAVLSADGDFEKLR